MDRKGCVVIAFSMRSASWDDLGVTYSIRLLGVLTVLAMVACGGGDNGQQASSTATDLSRNLSRTVEKQVAQRAIEEGKGQPQDLYCVRPNSWVSSEGNTEWACSFTNARDEDWLGEGTVDKDGQVLSFVFEKQIREPSFTPEQKPRQYWSAYSWCKRYRRTFYSFDDAVSAYGKAAGYPAPTDVESIGCEDGYESKTPKVPQPKRYDHPPPPPDD